MGRFDSGMLSAGTKRLFLAALLLAAFILKCEFIFKHSHYADHLFSDMGFYWQRAHARFNGDYFATDQWFANPPFFPIFLEQFLKILFFLRVSGHELEIAITFFIGLSTLSVLGVYGLAARLTGGFWRAFAAAALYAFAYPILYYNTFILTENLGMPLLILVLWLVMEHEESVAWMAAAGLFFGAAVAIRTAFGLIGLFIFFYLLAARPVSWARLRNALVFSAVFFAVIFFLLVENFFLSKGQVRGLAGYFGFNVFLQYCKVRNAYSGSGFYNNPTFIERHPEFGVFHTNHPFYDRAYFLDLVKGCIHDNPHVWLDNLKLLKDVFLYPPFPVLRDIAGFSFWMPAFCHLTLFLALSIGLFYWISPRERLWRWRMTLLLSPFFCALLMCYFFTMEGRILVPSLFGLYIIFFASVPHLLTNARKTDGYFAGLLLIVAYALTAFGVHEAALLKKYGVTSVQRVDLDKAALRVPDGTPGDQWGFFIMPNVQSGVLLSSKTPREARTLEISTDSMDSYRVLFYSNKKKIGELFLPAASSDAAGGTTARLLAMPPAMRGMKFDQILVKPVSGDGFYSLASILLDPVEKESVQKIYGVSSLSEVPLSKLSTRVPDASPGDKYGVMVMPDTQSGILILCPAEREARTIEISTDSYDAYQIDFYLHEVKKGSLPLPLARPVKGGTYKRVLKLPTAMAGTKFDRILVKPLVGDGFYSLAYLILDPA